MSRIAEGVAWVLTGPSPESEPEAVLVSKVPDQRPFLLEGSALVLWLCWADGLGLEATIAEAAELFGVDPSAVEGEVRELHERLVAQGVLVPGPGRAPDPGHSGSSPRSRS